MDQMSFISYLNTHLSVPGMPNTNNKLERTFTDLKKNLHNHSGLSRDNRKRFIEGAFTECKIQYAIREKGAEAPSY